MDRRESNALDHHITGNYGEDQFKNQIHPADEAWAKIANTHKITLSQEGAMFLREIFNLGWNAALKEALERSGASGIDEIDGLMVDIRD